MEDLGVKTVCPGHGEMGGPEVIANQKRWFIELREAVRAGVARGDDLAAIKESIDIPFYREWTGLEAKSRTENIEHVFKEFSHPGKKLGQRQPHRHPHVPHPTISRARPLATATPSSGR
ncbi:MAG: hypothetical protein ACKOCN_01570 [Planctomycetaceae bacterium]